MPFYEPLVIKEITYFRLNFYFAADEWRLKVLMGVITPAMAANSWSEFRKNFSMIETSNNDLLGDPYILFNKPFIGYVLNEIFSYLSL